MTKATADRMVWVLAIAAALSWGLPVSSQQVTGQLGSPEATTTLDGRQLPPPDPAFGGVIREKATDSTPWWPPRVVPPEAAPNILLIMTDDQGFGAPSTFGGVIPTPTMDKLATEGLRYTNIHSTAICSSTRAAIITGRNHHSVGFGVVGEAATGFPGYDSIIPRDKATIGTILRDNGYATSWFGKNHNTPFYEATQAGPFDHWPIGYGFDYFYGFVGGDTNQWQPNLFRNTTAIYPFEGNPGWNLETAMADDAIAYMKRMKETAPEKPFFVYYVPGATHAPHHPTPEWIRKIEDMHLFDGGWNKVREQIFANQKRLGIMPEDAQLTPWPKQIPEWDSLDLEQQKLFVRQADVYGAYLAYADHEIGRVIQAVEDLGERDNTLIIYIGGDNGASAEGGMNGTPNEFTYFNGVTVPVKDQYLWYPFWGSDRTFPHFSVGWAWAMDTPFKWVKQVASHFGGTAQGMVVSWPGHIEDEGSIRRQFGHVIDIVPTLLEVTGIPAPGTVDGIAQKPIEGTSLAYTWDKANAEAPTRHTTQYFEMLGNRAIYKDGWMAAARHGRLPWETSAATGDFDHDKWELYDLRKDFSQANDVAAQNPEKLKELQAAFIEEAKKYNVLPLDDRMAERFDASLRPNPLAGLKKFTYGPGVTNISESATLNTHNVPFSVVAEIEGGPDTDGVLAAIGGITAGWSLYVIDGKPTFAYNFFEVERPKVQSSQPLPSGKSTVRVDVVPIEPGVGKPATVTLFVNDKQVGTGKVERTVPQRYSVEPFDIGMDNVSPVSDDYKSPFPFKGRIEQVTIELK